MFISVFVFTMTKINLGKFKIRRSSKYWGKEITIPREASKFLDLKVGEYMECIIDIEQKTIIYKKVEG